MSAPDRAHSPLPWALGEDGLVRDVEGRAIGDPVDSAFAVLAVNFHDQLVAALQGLSGLAMSGYHTTHLKPAAAAARALLAEIESAER